MDMKKILEKESLKVKPEEIVNLKPAKLHPTITDVSSSEQRFKILYEISAVNSGNPEKQLDAIVKIASKMFGLEIGVISKIEKNKFTVLHFFHPEHLMNKGQTLSLENTYCHITIKNKEVIGIHHMKNSLYASHPCYKLFKLEAYVGVMLYVKGHLYGTLSFSSQSPRATPFSEEDKLMMGIVGSWISNILEAKENLIALKKSESHYKRLVEDGLAILCIHDVEGKIIEVNKAALRELGYERDEVIGSNLKSFMAPANFSRFDQYLERIIKNKIDSGVLSIKTKNGDTLYWSYKNTLENGEIIGFSQDITEKIKTDQTMTTLEGNLREAQALAKLGSWNYQIETGNTNWSTEIYNIYEVDPAKEEFTLQDSFKNVHPEDMEYLFQAIQNTLKNNEPYRIEYRLVLPNGVIKYILGKASPIIDNSGEITFILGTIQDITEQITVQNELKYAKEKAEEAARIKQEFLANMSHEIRTPMNAITGFSRLLLKAGLNEENTEYVRSIYESSETLLVVINDILDFSKIEAGKLPIVPVHFNLVKLLNSVKKLFSVKVDEGIIKFNFQIVGDIPEALIGDPVRINQILNNIIGNAIKFTEKGAVELKTSVISNQNDECLIEFEIKDTGIGISKEKLETIFNSFEQAEGDITRRFGGTGLGLTIVKKLVELMYGQIDVESKEGAGSTFSIRLPLQIGETEKIISEGVELYKMLPLHLLHDVKILLAEDNRYNQVLANKFLSDVGCKVDIVNNGYEAVEFAKNNEYDIILMDIQMPEMDGMQATQNIKNLDYPKCNYPIIAMTAHALKEEENKFEKIGMRDYVSKPFRPEILYAKLLGVLGYLNGDINLMPEKEKPTRFVFKPDEVDFSRLKEYAQGDHSFLLEALQIFLKDVPNSVSVMRNSLEQCDWTLLKRTVHNLKSSLSLVNMDNTVSVINFLDNNSLEELELEDIISRCEYIVENCTNALKKASIEITQYNF